MPQRLRLFSPPACRPELSRAGQKASGVYYTPPQIVRSIVDWTLEPWLDLPCAADGDSPPRVLDLACGAGEFLVEVQRRLSACYGTQAAVGAVVGIDIDQKAAAAARKRLKAEYPDFSDSSIQAGDALDRDLLLPGSFDLIVGNPPYVNIRQLAKSLCRKRIQSLRGQFRTARGNFDLYVLFIERAIELLRPGGRCGLIVPNKWATLDYARSCRELLLEQTTIERVVDLSDAGAFADASVYPHVLVFRKQPAKANHAIQFRGTHISRPLYIAQRSLSAAAIHLAPALDVESRAATQPLGDGAILACGTAGYTAARIATRLVDSDVATNDNLADFITSGNIDRYSIRLGHVRYLNRDYARPRLSLDIPELTPTKRRLFTGPKIVIAGMSRRLEAAWDDRGLALGVQVFACSDCRLDPFYLLALLNSKLLSYLFATRYAAKRLGGGYLAINKGQLARLPIRVFTGPSRAAERRRQRLSDMARELVGRDKLAQQAPARRSKIDDGGPSGAGAALSHPAAQNADAEIDQLVYQLYCLADAEIRRVEAHFAEKHSAAA
jgi:adenine-specific DNA-methyltransferase